MTSLTNPPSGPSSSVISRGQMLKRTLQDAFAAGTSTSGKSFRYNVTHRNHVRVSYMYAVAHCARSITNYHHLPILVRCALVSCALFRLTGSCPGILPDSGSAHFSSGCRLHFQPLHPLRASAACNECIVYLAFICHSFSVLSVSFSLHCAMARLVQSGLRQNGQEQCVVVDLDGEN